MTEAVDAAEGNDFYERVEQFGLMPLWHRDPAPEPRAAEVAHIWPWRDFQPLLLDAAHATGVSSWEAERRVLTLRNPGLQGRPGGATQTIGAALQLLLPGEVARAHRHSFHALRFVISGSGAYTVVDGQRVRMEPGDLVLTPGMCWHDHRHDGTGPMIWMDVLDSPFVHSLRGGFYEEHPSVASQDVVGAGAAAWQLTHRSGSQPRPPTLRYPWADALAAAEALDVSTGAHGCGPMVEYIEPETGRSVLPTLSCYIHRIPAGASTARWRHTPSSVCLVMGGAGHALVGDRRLAFEEHDLFVIPGWTYHEVAAAPDRDLILFRVSDAPIFHTLRFYREEFA